MRVQGAKIALLIDFDNVVLGVDDPPGFDVELVVNALRSRGVVVMGRAYGDWYRHHRHRRKLMEQGIELVETPVFGPVIKNSADIRIVLDGIDVASSHPHIDTFCLVSGDSDFLPLIKRLQLLGKTVIVIAGQKFTSDLVRRNCNEYLAYENLLAESIGATEDVSTFDGACQLLARTINTLLERGMDARSSTVKQMMLQLNPAFSERTFGCNQFKQFLDRAARSGWVELGERDHVSGEYSVIPGENELPEIEVAAAKTPEPKVESPGDRALRGETRRPRRGRPTTQRENGAAPAQPTAPNGINQTLLADVLGASSTPQVSSAPSAASAPPTGPARRRPAPRATPEATPQTEAEQAVPAASGDNPALAVFDNSPIAPVASTPLAARTGLRRGRLRFSAKSGVLRAPEPAVGNGGPSESETANTEAANEAVAAPTETAQPTPEANIADVAPWPEFAQPENADTGSSWNELFPIGEAPESVEAPQAESETPAEPQGEEAAPAEEAQPEAAPKKRTTRGRRKTTKTTKAKEETAEASAEAATPVADEAQAEAEAISAEAAAPEAGEAGETAEAPKKRTTRGRRGGTRRTKAKTSEQTDSQPESSE